MTNTEAQELAAAGPFIRGSEAWIRREYARAQLGAACVNTHEIPRNQAYGEPKAHLQQVDTSAYTERVRAELKAKAARLQDRSPAQRMSFPASSSRDSDAPPVM